MPERASTRRRLHPLRTASAQQVHGTAAPAWLVGSPATHPCRRQGPASPASAASATKCNFSNASDRNNTGEKGGGRTEGGAAGRSKGWRGWRGVPRGGAALLSAPRPVGPRPYRLTPGRHLIPFFVCLRAALRRAARRLSHRSDLAPRRGVKRDTPPKLAHYNSI